MTAFAEPFASSTDTPDLGGEAGGALVVTDGSSKSGYGSRDKATLRAALTAALSHDASAGVQHCS